ncbi:hypothetical protein MJO55_25715 [Mycolicibacterium rufum]|uniref:Uncharacterized protein n=1 Tax=Mycolicibacterium rufum TaxID=318424 RepID=A0A9X2YI29_9MYCO|nr:hypothetical protein [Mycolicibacterium rufum]KGI70247.1 hypothetical protein EU78_25615 [Mycolicibacterium rufum]MCV7074163.1 hypothetical protein [Mycolicibacterium rufum]ULP36539.1 hypothetical protein MJO55_25715 [Mycolicibacterium rufum]
MIPGVGPQLERAAEGTDPRGWLVFEYLPADLQRLEDQRAQLDRELYSHMSTPWKRDGVSLWTLRSTRSATDTERALLEHLGYEPPDDLDTVVDFTPGVRNRRWPALEKGTPS